MSTVEELVARSREAQKQFEFATQEQADAAARAVCKAVYDNQEMLGKMAAEESRMLSTVESIAQYLGVSLTSQQVQPVAEARQTDTLRQQHLVVDHGVTTASVVTLTTST